MTENAEQTRRGCLIRFIEGFLSVVSGTCLIIILLAVLPPTLVLELPFLLAMSIYWVFGKESPGWIIACYRIIYVPCGTVIACMQICCTGKVE